MPPVLARRQVVRSCKQRGWTIQPLALQGILEMAESEEDVEEILDLLNMNGRKTVTEEIFKELVDNDKGSSNHKGGSHGGASNSRRPGEKRTTSLSVINAFETPKLIYEVMRKNFYVEEKRYSLFGTAEDKTNMLCQRYALIHQRLLRNDLFRPNDLTRNSTHLKLTPIESLLGKSHDHFVILLGMLLQIEEGQWYLEDPTGQVPISFQSAKVMENAFVTEQSVFLVEGSFHDGIFDVQKLGQPLLEPRETSMAAIQQQVSHVAFRSTKSGKNKNKRNMADKNGESFVFLSDVHLDQPRVLQHLESLFATYEKYPPRELPVFVLMGNFSSVEEEEQQSACPPPMEELASLISSFTNLSKNAHFVLVPGPNDTLSLTLPFANTLPRAGFSRVHHVHWATNPCRIRFYSNDDDVGTSELVIFRYDLLHLMQRQQLYLQESPRTSEMVTEDDRLCRMPHRRLIKTILGQGHLCPVAGVPIAWNYDHTLSLYPIPHVLVMGGDGAMSKESRFHEVYEDCDVIHPGSITANGSCAVFHSSEDHDGPRVEFTELGVDK